MITPKQTRCARYCWAYVTKYAGVSARDIAGAQRDYNHAEVLRALSDLEAGGMVKRCANNGGMVFMWQAIIPFVVDARGVGV